LAPGAWRSDPAAPAPGWATRPVPGGGLQFGGGAGRSYFAAPPSAVLHPDVRLPVPGDLRSAQQRADYLVVGPREFLPAAAPLLDLRTSQGLAAKAVAIEDVYEQFGYGEASPEALKSFLVHAYQRWQRPSPRYVLLLGDATYDPKDYLHTGIANRVPALMVKTSYVVTASDPGYANVNGNALLPDLAIGRLPAGSLAEATTMIAKTLAFETTGQTFDGPALMVADNADIAGNFEADADDVADTML